MDSDDLGEGCYSRQYLMEPIDRGERGPLIACNYRGKFLAVQAHFA